MKVRYSWTLLNFIGNVIKQAFECHIKHMVWKGKKAAIVTLNNVQTLRIKQKLLYEQANDIWYMFESILKQLENELVLDDEKSLSSLNSPNVAFATKFLVSANKIYNDFQFIKSVFEIDMGDLRDEHQYFSLVEYFLYSLDLVLSSRMKSKISITIDPWMPVEVQGDLTKFRQILTALIDFSLKSTGEVSMKLKSDFIIRTGGYNIIFSINFTPQFLISK